MVSALFGGLLGSHVAFLCLAFAAGGLTKYPLPAPLLSVGTLLVILGAYFAARPVRTT